jgi:predicted Zn-dependent peptidase
MKRSVAFLLCPLLLSAGVTLAVQEPLPELPAQGEPFPTHRTTLANGLQVWSQPRPDSESVAALLVIRAGSRYEDVTNNGISHYVEHMVFTGTERWSEEEIKDVIRNRGGRWNGRTGLEQTTYYAQVAAGDFDVAMDWLAQVVFRATFPEEKVDKEREVIFQERWGRYGWLVNTLDSLGFGYDLARDIRRALYPGSSLGMSVIGEDASLEKLDRDALLAYYWRHYVPANAVLIVAGNVTPEQVVAGAEEYFGSLAGGSRPPAPEAPVLPDKGPHQVVVRGPMPTDRIEMQIGARTVGLDHPDRWPLSILAEVLGEELMEEIRYRRGLVYGVGAYNVRLDDTGYFAISASSERGNKETILQIIDERLEKVRTGEVDAEAVAEAKATLNGRWALAMEDNLARAEWLADWTLVLTADQPVPNYQASINAVRPEDLSRVVNTYFTPERSFLGLHTPVVTVASGVRAAGALVGLALAAWGAHRWRRRASSHGGKASG